MMHSPKIHFLLCLIGTLASFLFAPGCDQHAQDKKDIQALWKEWDRVNAEADGPAALKVYSTASFDFYTNLLKIGLTAPSKDVWNLPPHQMYEILLMRHRATRKELEPLDGKGYVAFATSKGWYAEAGVTMAIKDLRVFNDWASANMYDEDLMREYEQQKFDNLLGGRRRRWGSGSTKMAKPPEYAIRFVKEADGWKIEEGTLFPHTDQLIAEGAKFEEKSVRDFLMMIEEENSGKDVPMSVWEALKKAPAGKK